MGCSTFAEYTVVSEISCAKVADDADLESVCMLGCGVATGWGAAWKTADVEPGASVAVFGCGAVGLAVIQAAKIRGARRIFAVDTNPDKFAIAQESPRRALSSSAGRERARSSGRVVREGRFAAPPRMPRG